VEIVDMEETRSRKVLLWLLRLIMIYVFIATFLKWRWGGAIIVVVFFLHFLLYHLISRWFKNRRRDLLLTLVDIGLASLAYYATGDVEGDGFILVYFVIGTVSSRHPLWTSLAITTVVGLIFSWPLLTEIFTATGPIDIEARVNDWVGFYAISFVINYLVTLERREREQRIKKERALAELEATQERLVRAEKEVALMEMARTAAHELNQPLTVIKGYASLLLRSIGEEDPRYADLCEISKSVDRMSDIIEKIGKIIRYETKPYVGEAKIIDLEKAVEEVEKR
jgi:signal transduction histidine kinase